ncbi:sulfite exporter TauE/SafE family protein [Caballeronia sp. GAOx1]|uniref:sulfite exporter TauE/SafE family protein n=1 Tax=Caballeronia sp. GAOx1 TaxID=2921761 RepID=UPI0020298476|nr:sulfite exporter TauE/SafE family protein [Caballeronia sp. GAOx1]
MPHLAFVTNAGFYIAGIPAVLLTSLSKGGLGLGLGIVAVPLMALSLPVTQVITILLPILCVTDLVALWQYRGEWSWPILRLAIPAALVGAGFGILLIHRIDAAWLRLGVGAMSVDYALRRGMFPSLRFRPHEPDVDGTNDAVRPRPTASLVWGTLSGLASFLTNAGEPALTMYLLPFRLSNRCFASTTSAFFAAVNLCKLASFTTLGLFSERTLLTSALLLPVALIGTYVGIRANRRLNSAVFARCSCAVLLIIGIRLMYTSARSLL